MAAHGWGKSPSVKEWLLAEAHRFDFYQAVALLESVALAKKGADVEVDPQADVEVDPQAARTLPPMFSVGEAPEPSLEAIRFTSTISLAFPETDIDSVRQTGRGVRRRFVMKVNFMSLAGAVGPLPPPFAELVLQRASRHDPSARDFLDIFNHRLVSIAYRIRKMHRIGLGTHEPLHDETTRQLYAFMGLGSSGFSGSLRDSYRALLHHAGAFAREVRSMTGLETILRHHFGAPIEGVQFTGRFYNLDDKELTTIGPSGRNRTLGRDALVGSRVWDQTSSFEIRVGPLSLKDYLRFLPGGDALVPLCRIVRLYVGITYKFTVRLILKASQVPATRLGYAPGNMLTFTAWIGKARRTMGDPEVVLSSTLLEAELDAVDDTGKPKPRPRGASPGGDGARSAAA